MRTSTHLLVVLSACILGFGLVAPGYGATVQVTLGIDPDGLAGADGLGRVLLFAPNPVQTGSSISHWDRSASPNLLMEPSISTNLPLGRADVTLAMLEDIGWPRGSSNIIIQAQDAPGEGFNDPALGAQRMQAMQFVANFWGSRLASSVPIRVNASFEDLECGEGGSILGQAFFPHTFHTFAGAPVGDTWYPGALAESLSGQNLSLEDDSNPSAGDIVIRFNRNIDNGCLGNGSGFHYGSSGGLPQGDISFVNVALHEMGHGLGFASLVRADTGLPRLGRMDIFSRQILDNTNGLHWDQMTTAQRKASAINTGHVVWTGAKVTQQAGNTLQPGPSLVVHAPASIAGKYLVGEAQFGPPLSQPGVFGEMVLANDGSGQPTLGCNPLINGPLLQGRVALIDRGECNFTVKVKNAQNAGARGVIIANNTGGGAIALGGNDNSVNIPSLSVSLLDGIRLKNGLNQTSFGTLSMGQAVVQVSEGDTAAQLTVNRSNGTTGQVSVTYQTQNGSAIAGADYLAAVGTITFADGQGGSQNFSIPLVDDGISESLESFTVALSNATGGAEVGTPVSTRVDIADNEPCIEDANTLCLLQNRFRVQVEWLDFANEVGNGQRVPADSDNSALLYFFDPNNWEMLIKIIDGCSFNDHYWVFAAATTNVQYSLTVTDTATGVSKPYNNPLGQASPAVTDTAAFATCP